ncbi:MAG: serine hydrolase [Planctomycetota bacterium]|nr:serine hydrolase [Planctomycetota bacterium]
MSAVSSPALAQNNIPWRHAVDITLTEYDVRMSVNASEGYRPVSISGRSAAGGTRFDVVWIQDGTPASDWRHTRGLTRAQAQTWATQQAAEGFIPIAITAYPGGSSELYAIVSKRSASTFAIAWNLSRFEISAQNSIQSAAGRTSSLICNWSNGAETRYTIVYTNEPSGGWASAWNQSTTGIQSVASTRDTQGYRLVSLQNNGTSAPIYAGVWRYVPQPEGGRRQFFNQTAAEFNSTVASMTSDGFRPELITGAPVTGGTRFSSAWVSQIEVYPRTWRVKGRVVPELAALDQAMQTYMQANRVSASQLAITYGGRLVFNRAYTWDKPTNPDTTTRQRFRTASVCKPQVATVVMQLVEQGLLSLDDQMVRYIGGTWADPRVAQITIRDLLRHSGGWDRDVSPDPMILDTTIAAALGVPLPISRNDIVRYMQGQLLDRNPGSGWYYSNFGYMLLGMIVEQIAGTTYEDRARQYVWENVGAWDDPRVTSFRVPFADEPVYDDLTDGLRPSAYQPGTLVPNPYGSFNSENLSSVGSWVTSARDLARFTRASEDVTRTNLLAPASVQAMLERQPYFEGSDFYYGLGWFSIPGVGNVAFHGGDMPGTAAEIGVLINGSTYAGVTNVNAYYTGGDAALYAWLEPLLLNTTQWPAGDLWCRADFSFDGTVDFFDYLDFAQSYAQEDEAADVNEDGQVDFFDYLEFAQAFDQGC